MTQRMPKTKTSRHRLQEYQGAMLTEAASTVTSKVRQAEAVIDNMMAPHNTGLMLTGATGIGKTTFIKQLAKLFGMNVIIVEIPHLSEEHLINIPFTVTLPSGNKRSGTDQRDPDTYDIVLGKSYLASELEKSKPISDAELLQTISGADDNIKEMWKHFGGTASKIPDEFKKIRSKYHVFFFLDEYLRQTSKNVRNILRNILNGKIGNDPIPLGAYVICASNLGDVSGAIEDIPKNADFQELEFNAPTKEEWFSYLVNKYKNSSVVKLKPEVVTAFRNALSDADISYDDKDTELRTSPRRWEQLILYINQSLPCKDLKDARAMLAAVKSNFQYGAKVSAMYRKVETIVKQLITATNPNISNVSPADSSDWRNILLHQLQVKMQLGDIRSYVPVIQGEPGIGKTHFAAMVADQLNMSLIPIDCSTLTADDLVGIPIPKSGKGSGHEGMEVGFAEPVLYKRIMQDMKLADQAYNNNPRIPAEKKAQYNNAKYKYLLFFDELTRVNSPTVYNALRRVILEKEFSDDPRYRIPENCIIVAAMNPDDVGVQEITGHLKDSIDIIDAKPSWSSFEQHVKNSVFKRMPDISQPKKQAAWDLVNAFAEAFTTKQLGDEINTNNRKFYIQYGPNASTDLMYISPREYDVLFQTLALAIRRATQENLSELLRKAFDQTLKWIIKKHKLEIPAWKAKVDLWIVKYAESMSRTVTEKQRDAADLAPMLDRVLDDPTDHLYNNLSFLNLLKNFSSNLVADQFRAYLYDLTERELDKSGRLASVFISKNKKKKVLDQRGVPQFTKDLFSEVEFLMNEFAIATEKANAGNDFMDEMRKTLHDFMVKDLSALCTKHGQPLSRAEFDEIGEKLTKKIF